MEEDSNNYTRVKQALEATGLFDEYYEKFTQQQMDDEIMMSLIQDVDLSQNLQRLIPVLGHEMKFKLEFKKLCGDEIPIKLPLFPYLQQEMMDYEFMRPDARKRRGRGRAKSKNTPMSTEMKAKTLRKPPKDRASNKFHSSGSLNTVKRRGRPPKIWPTVTATSSSSSGNVSSNGPTSSEVNRNGEDDIEHGDMNDCVSSPYTGNVTGTAATSPPIKKARGRPSLKKNNQVINSFYQRAQQNGFDDSTSPTKSEQQQQGSFPAQNTLENPFKRPRGRPPKKANSNPNSKQHTAKKQKRNTEKERLVERNMTEVGVKNEINDGFPFEHEELEEMPLIHVETAQRVNEDEQDLVVSKAMPILSSTLLTLVDNSPNKHFNVAVKSSPSLHPRKQTFILKSESESLTENLRD